MRLFRYDYPLKITFKMIEIDKYHAEIIATRTAKYSYVAFVFLNLGVVLVIFCKVYNAKCLLTHELNEQIKLPYNLFRKYN